MKRAGCAVLLFTALVLGAALAPSPAAAAARPPGVPCGPGDEDRCDAWWARQTREVHDWILSQAAEDRQASVVCFALFGYPDGISEGIRSCAARRVAERKSMAHCMGPGPRIDESGIARLPGGLEAGKSLTGTARQDRR